MKKAGFPRPFFVQHCRAARICGVQGRGAGRGPMAGAGLAAAGGGRNAGAAGRMAGAGRATGGAGL